MISLKKLFAMMVFTCALLVNTGLFAAQPVADDYKWERNWMWMYANMQRSDEDWTKILAQLKEGGITGILIGGGVPMLEKVIPLADKFDIDVHAWMWTLNRPGDKVAKQHPDWYTVSGKGESCFDVHPYVDYYQWVCPSKEEVYEHIAKQVKELASVKGVKGVHLDYVRYADVILAKALQPKYNLVQDKEYPEFDFCYCETCTSKFKEESGIDITKVEDPTAVKEWREYRYNSVTHLVNRLVKIAHENGKQISAAVFPYPQLARTICRQSWDEWDLDAVFPMVYQNFYDEDMKWVKTSTRKGVKDLKGKAALITGLFRPQIPEGEFPTAVENSFKGGADGVAVFGYAKCKPEDFTTIVELGKKYQNKGK
ncbi:family 10 glycosylhydrolase [Labilibaculum sp.]|uniref:family 10 glycosylhydrolase n=1 Tax=Labilibaculum sp. TaxID=2060723 RepID=UPI0035666663